MHRRFIILLAGLALVYSSASAQDEGDALRYSYLTPGGTARMQAAGRTGVSLGGDPGDLTLNPAGLGLFKSGDFSFTPGFHAATAKGNYLGESASDNKGNLYIQQFGLIFASDKKRNNTSRWQNVSFGLGLNRQANFNRNIYFQGLNDQSSYSEKYLEQLSRDNVTDMNDAANNYPYGASLAFNTYLIDTTAGPAGQVTGYQSFVPLSGGVLQANTISTKGGLNEFALGVAGNYDNKLYLGLSLGIPSINFKRTNTFSESIPQDNGGAGFQSFQVVDNLSTSGVGFNGKLGLIYVVNPKVRIGAAFHSPTVFSLHDTYTTTMLTNTGDFQGALTQGSTDLNQGYPGDYDYSLTTPWRAMGGISFVMGASADAPRHGFLNVDYEYVNYGAARFHFNGSNATADDKAVASALNQSISSMYKGASNVRVGGELKFNVLAVRAGFDWMGSPYADADIDAAQMRYSAGVGIRSRGVYADLTYVYSTQKDTYYPYLLQDKAVSPASLQYNASNIVFTIGFTL